MENEPLKQLIQIASDGLSKKEFLNQFSIVIDVFKKFSQNLSEQIDSKTKTAEERLNELQTSFETAIEEARAEAERVKEENQGTLSSVKKWIWQRVHELFLGSLVNKAMQERAAELEQVVVEANAKVQELKNFAPPDATTLALQASTMAQEALLSLIPPVIKVEEELKALLPKMGDKTKEGLEAIEDEKDKLSIKAIGHLQEQLDELKKKVGNRVAIFGGSVGKHNTEVYDLSASLDGTTTTFNVPAMWKLILVLSTSTPRIFRPTVDFTSTNTSVTFTSEIDPTTTLATGQTVLLVYQSN